MTGASKRRVAPVAPPSAPDMVVEAASDFPPPPWLVNREARGVWLRIAPELRRLNILAPSDADVFARYCFHFAGWIGTLKSAPIGKEYTLVKMTGSDEKMPRLHPAVKARELHEKHLVEIEDRFGGSPLARIRIIAQQAAHPGAFGDLFNRQPTAEDTATPSAPAPAAPVSPIGALQRPTAH